MRAESSAVLAGGLTAAEAARRLAADGPNVLPAAPQPKRWRLLVEQLTHFFAVMLWVAAGLALLAGLPPLAAAIVVIIVLNGVFAFAQEYRADQAAQRLQTLIPVRVRVRRDGTPITVAATDVVRGDLVLLDSGDRVGADLRIVQAHGLAVDESMLTGESVPVRPGPGGVLSAGTFVVEGDAETIVEEIGGHTRIAGIAALTKQAHRPPSPLDVQLHRLVVVLAVIATVVGVALSAAALLIGLSVTQALLFGVGVTVALVPEGLLPTVTLSLARGAQKMASRNALVRHLEAVETLGATTFICTDKTGTLTRNEMSVVEVWTSVGTVTSHGDGYVPEGVVDGPTEAVGIVRTAAYGAVRCVKGRVVLRDGCWHPEGDPMEVALDVLSRRLDVGPVPDEQPDLRIPFTTERMSSAVVVGGIGYVLGAPEFVLRRCVSVTDGAATQALDAMTAHGQRVLAVAVRTMPEGAGPEALDKGLDLLALIGIEDPPRQDVGDAIAACHRADIRIAMLTGDNPGTAAAIAKEVGLLRPGGTVLTGGQLPADDQDLADLLDRPEGAVVARVTPADKLRIARALRSHGHVVAMTGDGVNDAPALREADVGVAMGKSGSDVAREAADLVLLDDHFATVVSAIELGRATFANVRRFLTYHLTDNVAEVAPFAVWALTGSSIPLAIGVLQVLALDIGTDMLPALALGAEPPSRRTMDGHGRARDIVDGHLLRRALGVLGPTEALLSMGAFLLVLLTGGWGFGDEPSPALLATASGTTFAVIAACQMANAFACRSESRPAWLKDPRRNPLVVGAVVVELALLGLVLGLPPVAELLGGDWPSAPGWWIAVGSVPVLLTVDAAHKAWLHRRSGRVARTSGGGLTSPITSRGVRDEVEGDNS